VHIKRIQAPIIAGLLLLTLILPQLALAAGPVISDVVVLDRTSTTATIYWTTNTTSDSWVYYRLEDETTWVWEHDSTDVTTHFIELTGLEPGETYQFWIKSIDAYGTTEDDNDGEYYQFTTGPPQYSITLDHACGVCGELIEAKVCGELIGATVTVATKGTYHICWDSREPWDDEKAMGVVDTFTASGAGSDTIVFYMPEAKKGTHTVYLVDSTYGQKAKADFEVLPSVKIDPEEGPVNTEVTVNCYGFKASGDIQASFLDTEEEGDTNTLGSWELAFTIPPTPAGGYNFEIKAKEGTVWVDWVSKYFEVTPEIAVNPDSGKVGQTIEVEGTGFASEEEDIEITFDGEPVETNMPIVADENGSWQATIVTPPLQRGTYIIDASGESTRARDVDDVEFTLGAGILVEPGSAYVADTITVTGGGFRAGETGIRVTFEGKSVATGITADSNGNWETSFVVPASTYGSHTVEASGDITSPAVTATLDTEARIEELSPAEGAPGDSVTLTGSGFHGSQDLTVTIGGVAASEDMRTQSNGNVAITFRVPKGSIEGKRTLVVTDEDDAADELDFTVKKKILSTTPLPISPKEGTLRSGEVTFRWQGVTGGTDYTYTLEINTSAGSGNIWSKSGIEESSYTLIKTETVDETLDKGTYYWRVKIVDDYGNESEWSDSIEFRVSPIPTWVWVVVGLVVLTILMVVAYRETKFKVSE
jgi:hypothetical protein